MAPLPVIANTYRCALNWAAGSQIAENVIHVREAASSSSAVFAALQAAFVGNQWKSASATAFIESITITPLDGSSVTQTFATTVGTVVGGTSGNWAPNVAVIAQLQTAKRGRSYRGRVFVPFTADSAQVDGQVVGATASAMETAWNTFVGSLFGGTGLVVASYKHSTAEAVTNVQVGIGCATQRRRQTRVRYP